MKKTPTSQHHKISRREFTRKASILTAAPFVLSSALRGEFSPNNRVNIGVIGVGNQSTVVNLNGFAKLSDTQIVACADPDSNKREIFIREIDQTYGSKGCDGYSDYRELLARNDIDAVVICTPDHWHVSMGVAAIKAGKDIYMEKPLSLCLDWSKQLIEAMKGQQIVFQFGTQQRSERQFQQAVSLVRNGYIGELKNIDVWCPDLREYYKRANPTHPFGSTEVTPIPKGFDYDLWCGPAPLKPHMPGCLNRWYQINDHSLGYIGNWGVHMLDIAQWGTGMDGSGPTSYEGIGTITPGFGIYNNVEDWDIHCKYTHGVKLRFMSSTLAESVVRKYHYVFHNHGTVFHGTEGWVGVDRSAMYSHDRNILRKIKFRNSDNLVGSIGTNAKFKYGKISHQRNFIDSMRSRKQPLCPFETAVSSDTIGILSDMCVRSKAPIKWNPDTRELIHPSEQMTTMLNREMRQPYGV